MASNTAFEHTKEMVGSMSFDQVKSLQTALDARLEHFLIASKVFGITELLEQILEHLDFFSIFTLMRVNRAFRDTVLGSKPLHRQIFMLPHESPAADAPLSSFDRKATVNPYIQDAISDVGLTLSGCFYIDAADRNRDRYDNAPPVDPILELHFTIPYETMNELAPADQEHYYPSWRNRHFVGAKDGHKGSWALTRINAFPVRIRLAFMLDDVVCRNYFSTYHELEPEEATLGALYNLSVVALECLANKQIVSNNRFAADFVRGPHAPE